MSEYIEGMRRSMTEAGVYSKEDINEICSLESEYEKECSEIALQCMEEGYPSQSSTRNMTMIPNRKRKS